MLHQVLQYGKKRIAGADSHDVDNGAEEMVSDLGSLYIFDQDLFYPLARLVQQMAQQQGKLSFLHSRTFVEDLPGTVGKERQGGNPFLAGRFQAGETQRKENLVQTFPLKRFGHITVTLLSD